jgi:hypothetical protein
MKKLIEKLEEEREIAYRAYREAELTADEKSLAHISGIVEGMDIIINLIKESMEA